MSGLLPNMASTKPPLTLSLKVRTRYSLSMDTRGKGACLPQQNADREKKEKQVFTFTSTYLICNGTQFRPCKRKLDRWVKCQALTVFFYLYFRKRVPWDGIAPIPRAYMNSWTNQHKTSLVTAVHWTKYRLDLISLWKEDPCRT